MSEPYYHPASIQFREPAFGAGLKKPKTTAKAGKAYIIRNSGTLYHHLTKQAWLLESRAERMQYEQGYLFEDVVCVREEAQHYKNLANNLMGINPLEWCKLFEGATCEI